MADPRERRLPTRIWYGDEIVDRISEAVAVLGVSRVFLVTDPGLAKAGHADRVERAFAKGGLTVRRFEEVEENPTSDHVQRAVEALGDWDADVLVGLGGGSSIDVAKGCALVHAGGGRMEDYRGYGKARGKLLPLVAIPTTAGTGTETQSFALIGESGSHQKMACGDPQVAPRLAILDPSLTVTQPAFVTACTAIDALGHALETAVTRSRGTVSSGYGGEAFRLVNRYLPLALATPDDLEARGALLRAAAFAGIAIEHSMLGAAHSMANPLTAHHGIEHGRAVGLALAPVIRFNGADPGAARIYAELARAGKLVEPGADDVAGVEAVAARVEELMSLCALDRPALSLGDVSALAAEAAGQWTAQFNPRPIVAADFRRLFKSLASPNGGGSG